MYSAAVGIYTVQTVATKRDGDSLESIWADWVAPKVITIDITAKDCPLISGAVIIAVS